VHAVLNPDAQPRLMFAGHADQIGFVIQYVDDEGFLYMSRVGGIDVAALHSRRIRIWTSNGPILGVFGRKSIHLMTEEERKKTIEIHELWVDIGAKSAEEAMERVSLGDPATFAEPFERLYGDLCVSPGFDNKMGSFVMAETVRLLKGKTLKASVHAVSTVQEEIGLRGARTSSYHVGAKVGIAVDVGHVSDYPGIDKRRVGGNKVGAGPMICRGANINHKVFEMLIGAAKEEEIPYQIEVAGMGTGTDANAMQLNQAGMATGLVSAPLRYMHSTCELMSLTDIENTARLCAAFALRVNADVDFTP
ncbi:MAG: M20/M25/M40 family metallo-hydrolase, partial [Armatimonadota bacterium]|nr:M20/M25/M40 family metallo-hydrolase [Armatimonadota bacterium]